MGAPDIRNLAPTDTESVSHDETETVTSLPSPTEVSRITSQTIPEDGTPITVATRKSRKDSSRLGISKESNHSKTSLLIEYYEGGKGGETTSRKPSVRVKVTPSSKGRHSKDDHILVTETKGKRKASVTRRIDLPSGAEKIENERLRVDGASNGSLTSYGSLTEESNLSRNPIEIEVMPRRPSSPLIPSETRSDIPLGSDVSSMPANSFLDGKTRSPERKHSLSKAEILAGGAVAGLAAGAIADKLKTPSRRRSRSLSRERIITQKVAEKIKGDRTEKRRKSSGSRSRSASHTDSVTSPAPRRRSSRNHEEISTISGADTSQISGSRASVDQRSYRSGTSKASSINNPKLLETVEDAIRRLILPELTALKQEQKAHISRDRYERRGSITSGSTGLSRESREEIRKVSGGRHGDGRSSSNSRTEVVDSYGKLRKERKSDHGRTSFSPQGTEREDSSETVVRDSNGKLRTKKSTDKKTGLVALAAGLGLGALTAHALQNQSRENLSSREALDERQERRRRRGKSRSRSDSLTESYDSRDVEVHPPMPMMSEVNASDVTRSSIRSVDTERPAAASHERIMTKDVRREVASPVSRTPTRTPRSLTPHEITPTQHLGRLGELDYIPGGSRETIQRDEMELDEHGRKVPMHDAREHIEEEIHHDEQSPEPEKRSHNNLKTAAAVAAGALLGGAAVHHYNDRDHHDPEDEEFEEEEDYYQNQGVVPPPLKYVPYNQEKRGLSPIQSVSGFTEDEYGHGGNHALRDSRTTRSTGTYSAEQSPEHRQSGVSEFSEGSPLRNHHDFAEVRHGGLNDSEITRDGERPYWEDERNREFDGESYRSSDPRLDYDYDDENMDSPYRSNIVGAGQNVRGIGGKPDFVHTPVPVESAVASLLDGSELTGSGRSGLDRQASYASYDEGSEKNFTSRGNSPRKHDTFGSRDFDQVRSQVASLEHLPEEYELDEHGHKVSNEKNHTGLKTAAAGAAGVIAGAAAAKLLNRSREHSPVKEQYQERLETTGAPLQKSFKDRARDLETLSPQHSIDRFSETAGETPVKMFSSGIPDANDPMPEIGYHHDDMSETGTRHSYIEEPLGGKQQANLDHWPNMPTPKQPIKVDTSDEVIKGKESDSKLKEQLLAAAGAAGAAAAVVAHNRTHSQDLDEQWQRTSDERKRDTLITNPYEGTSPVTLLGGQPDRNLLDQMGYNGAGNIYDGENAYATGSPGLQKDEGYISSAPNALSPGPASRHVGFASNIGLGTGAERPVGEDPFYMPKHTRHLSGLSNGMDSPIYDNATGAGIDRIQSKDIIALMDHLTVRDAQRSARDTEILVTLVSAATEMRNSFEDMKRLLADTEDVIITEVQRNTDKSVTRAINGPRPPPASVARSTRGSTDEMIDDIPNKRRNVFRRALKGLSMRSNHDLAKIEDMLVQLLGDVEGLKVAQGLPGKSPENERYQGDQYDDNQQEGAYEQDRGYEPEGHAGSTTVSHASQSGHFSNPLSRGASAPRGDFGRRYSENRISTVPEGDEEELDHHEEAILANQFENNEQLLTPIQSDQHIRAGSAPLGTPPQTKVTQASLSNENTPTTGKSRRSGWNPIPKISRWSETTASSVAKNFRSSRDSKRDTIEQEFQSPTMHSRSGSDLGNYTHDPYGEDKLRAGYSNDNLDSPGQEPYDPNVAGEGGQLRSLLPPEDPKYKAHRNSLNLQHPQPRQGPTPRYQTHLETQAMDYDVTGPGSPRSVEWGGSSNSINRLPPNSNAPTHGNTNRYSTDTGPQSPLSDSFSHHSTQQQGLAPARPPKEPIAPEIPPKVRNRLTKPSPLSSERLPHDIPDEDEGRASPVRSAVPPAFQGSPRSDRRVLSANLSAPTRKPTGPRSMGSGSGSGGEALGRRKRDTFGTIGSAHSGESETF